MRHLIFLLLILPGFLRAQSWSFYGRGDSLRIFVGTIDGRLIAIDGHTGQKLRTKLGDYVIAFRLP